MKNKQPTKEDIKLAIAKSKSPSLRKKVEDVYSLKDDSKTLKGEIITNSVAAGVMGVLTLLSGIDVIKSKSAYSKAFYCAWILGFAVEDAYTAYKCHNRKKDIDADIVLIEDQIFNESKALGR